MKHGDKTKGKASKASGKKAQPPSKASKKAVALKAKGSGQKARGAKAGSKAGKPEAGTSAGARGTAESGFTNPAVGAAFKHALKKYPNAFRKLTD